MRSREGRGEVRSRDGRGEVRSRSPAPRQMLRKEPQEDAAAAPQTF